MRKVFLFIFCTLLLLPMALAGAAPQLPTAPQTGGMETRLKLLQGDWLNPKGHLVLEIKGRKINGCEITNYEDLVDRTTMGTTVFWVLEAEGERKLQMDWRIFGDENDYIFLDGSLMLRRDGSL